jgi:hypothetical protein
MPNRRQAILLAIGVASGLGLAVLDSLPSWDDSGILAGAMLLASGVLGLAGARPPWLLGLAVGAGIPVRAIVAGGDPRIAVVLIIPLLGAYGGSLIRQAVAGAAGSA